MSNHTVQMSAGPPKEVSEAQGPAEAACSPAANSSGALPAAGTSAAGRQRLRHDEGSKQADRDLEVQLRC